MTYAKQLCSGVILFWVILCFWGCSSNDVCVHEYSCYTTNVTTDDGYERYYYFCKLCGDDYYKTIKPDRSFPEHISAVAERFQKIIGDNDSDFVIGSPSYGEDGVEMVVAGKSDSEFEGIRREFAWYYSDDTSKEVGYSFSMLFNTETEHSFIKEVLTASIMCLADSDYDQARSQMQSLVNSYSTYANSDLLQIDDWIIYFSQRNVVDTAFLNFRHLSEIENATIDPSDYLPVDYNMCQAPAMNKGTKFHIVGTVEAISFEPTGHYRILHVLAEDGNTYEVEASYAYPVTEGTKYEFWVVLVDSTPCLSSQKICLYSASD